MTSPSSQPRLETLVPLARCTECCRRKIKCDKSFPECDQCRKRGRTCVFPESQRGRRKLAASKQRQLSPNVESQPNGEKQQHTPSNNMAPVTDSTNTAPLDLVVSILERVNSPSSSTSTGRKSKRIAMPLAVAETRVRRRRNNEHVGLASPKRRIRDKELIYTAQASSRKGTMAPSKQIQSDEQHISKSLAIPLPKKGEHPSNMAPRKRGRPRKIRPVEDEEAKTNYVCGAVEEAKTEETLISCEKCTAWQHLSCAKYFCESSIVGMAQKPKRDDATQTDDSIGDSILQLQTSLEGARYEIQLLQEKIAQKEDEMKEQADRIKTLWDEKAAVFSARMKRDKNHQFSLEDLATYYEGRLQKLNKELKSREALGVFTRQSSGYCDEFGKKNVGGGIKEAYWSSRKVVCRYNNDKAPFIPALDQHEMFRSLVYKLLGLSDSRFDALDQAKDMLSKLSSQAIIRALTATAMKVWAFQIDFPRFDTGISMILQGTRECIRDQDGPVALRNIDLATHSSLIRSKEFREKLVPQKATGLAIQLSNTLTPFFSNASPHRPLPSDWDGFSTWGEDMEEWKARRVHFIDLFTNALIAKADSCLNSRDYELVSYLPGTPFDNTTMKAETIEGAPNSARNHYGRRVQLCVEAALFAHPVREIASDASVAEAIVSTANFISRDQNEKRVFKPIIKAVVILFED